MEQHSVKLASVLESGVRGAKVGSDSGVSKKQGKKSECNTGQSTRHTGGTDLSAWALLS